MRSVLKKEGEEEKNIIAIERMACLHLSDVDLSILHE